MLLHTCFFLTANTSAHTLILHGHTHMGLSSRENPHSTVALQKLINVPTRGISRLAFHYKAGVFRGEMGTVSWMAALGLQGKVQSQCTAQTCPSPALHNPFYRVSQPPAEPHFAFCSPPRTTTAQQTAPGTSITSFWWFPTQLPALLCLWDPMEGSR